MRVTLALISVAVLLMVSTVDADTITINVDSAPNRYGSPDWDPWWTAAKSDVVAGTFTNMRTGTYPSTTTMDPIDEIVYSTGDRGKRLHWIYWLPAETTTSLSGRFEVKWVIDYFGGEWTYEGGTWAANGPEVGWVEPASWEDYSSGVIGSQGFAWWATDNEAPPPDSGGSAYDEVDAADVNALRTDVFDFQTFATGYFRIRDGVGAEWEVCSLRVDVVKPVPLPGSLWLGLALLGSLAGIRRIRRRR